MATTEEDIVRQWENGELSIDDADEINDIDGYNIEAKFEVEDGYVILTYDLNADLCYRPDPDGDGTVCFNLEHAVTNMNNDR